MTATEYIVLVDAENHAIGTAEKLAAHQLNLLHRAFSVFIFRTTPRLELLLQQRAHEKYHCGGLWTNTCCSHPRPGETVIAAGERRLQEELGFTTPLKDLGWFQYNAHFTNGLSEHEIDHVLIGKIDESCHPNANPNEIAALRWITVEDLKQELATNPKQFTPWLAQALEIASANLHLFS